MKESAKEMRENKPPSDFRGLLRAPSSEQEVVLLFGLLLPYLDEPLSIDECHEAFPDCLAIRSHTGVPVRIEFELNSSNFLTHGHDPSGCDMVVCWLHDWMGCPNNIEVFELSRFIREHKLGLVRNLQNSKYPVNVWTKERFIKAVGQNPQGYVLDLLKLCSPESGLEYVPGTGKQACFTIRITRTRPMTLLGVNADGKIWANFIGLPKPFEEQYGSALCRIARIKESAMTKTWFNFTISDEKELDNISNALRLLVTI